MTEPTIPDNMFRAAELRPIANDLYTALDKWSERDDTKAQPNVRQAANDAVTAIDTMLRELHSIRGELVTEIRRSDDATGARIDAMLAESRARRAGN